jgi:hypothetical protein
VSNNLPDNPNPEPKFVYTPEDQFWSGYPGESREGMQYLREFTMRMPYGFSDFRGLPERVDPRLDKKFADSWMRVENQGGVGAPFDGGTLVTLVDGKTKPLSELKFGDRLKHFFKPEGSVVTSIHTQLYTGNMVTVSLDNGETFVCTADHQLVPVGKSPITAIDVEVGDEFVAGVGKTQAVCRVSTHYVEDEVVICPTVDGDHLVLIAGVYLLQCQGYSLVHCVEYLYAVLTGQVVQLAPLFAYLMSQYYDGIKSDSGSTLSGGTKVLEKNGLCLLEEYPKERSYPRGGYKDIPQSALEAAKNGPFKMLKTVRFKNADEFRAFAGSYAGIIQTGTKWTNEMARVPSHGVWQSLGSRSMGGHAYNICGYMPIDELGAEARRAVPRTSSSFINIVTNSHSTQWADEGFGYITDELFNELNRSDLLLGRTDMGDIKPRPSKRDFTTVEHSRFSLND